MMMYVGIHNYIVHDGVVDFEVDSSATTRNRG